MSIKLANYLIKRFPNLGLVEKPDSILSVCGVDGKRYLGPREVAEDYSLLPGKNGDEVVVRVFTTYASSCESCERKRQ